MTGALPTTAVVMVAAAVICCALVGCTGGKHLRKANVAEVTEGMSKKQVESILGMPTSVDSKDWVISKTTVYIYQQGKEAVTLVFKDDKLQSKDSTLSE